MTITLPKELRSLEFTELTMVELNDIDIDRLLPHLWELIVKQGRIAPSRTNAEDYDHYLRALAADSRLDGFDTDQSRKVLDGWLRSSVVRIGATGRGRSGSKMDYVLPLTIASYRAGLPKSRSRHRHAETLVYDLLIDELQRRSVEAPESNLHERFRHAVGGGVHIGTPATWVATYDGKSDIDINALLSLYFLEQFEPSSALDKTRDFRGSAVPGATRELASDLLDYLTAYSGRLTPSAFIDRFAALISLRLFQLPLRVARSMRHLLKTGEKSEDMGDDLTGVNPLELYCDFTGVRGSASDELARQCVQRDLEITRGFLPDRLLLRSLRDAVAMLGKRGQEMKSLPMADSLVEMVREKDNPLVSAYAVIKMQAIEQETRDSSVGTDEDLDLIARITASAARPPVEQLTQLLIEGLAGKGLENQIRWFWSTGGVQKPYGLLTGALTSRRSWRYAPSDDLIVALLLVCFTQSDGRRTRPSMPIADLLLQLRARFGILIDRPPAAFDSVDNRAAAASNLEAFKRRLQLLGCFDGLSDDFSAQFVKHPLEAV
ncbi:methylation-associated defense system protein MAD7 [Micromonospora sp. DT229]|uniref:methylation-associated defense system protein MAD7 n=1 Tax=Micromonospora sp. DT229 TaxID=3393430 RepID=UPI003CEC6509